MVYRSGNKHVKVTCISIEQTISNVEQNAHDTNIHTYDLICNFFRTGTSNSSFWVIKVDRKANKLLTHN